MTFAPKAGDVVAVRARVLFGDTLEVDLPRQYAPWISADEAEAIGRLVEAAADARALLDVVTTDDVGISRAIHELVIRLGAVLGGLAPTRDRMDWM